MANINVNQTNASETAKGIVEEATQAEVNAGTDTGGTGAKVFVTPSKLLSLLGDYLTTASAAATYLTIVTAAATYQTVAGLFASVMGLVLTGFAAGSNAAVTATDTLAQALAKFQGQINARPNETATTIAAINHGTAAKTSLVDADEITGQDSANSFSLIRTTWTDVKAFLKTYFDTLYATASNTLTFTNKRITARVGTTASSGTPTINTDNVDMYRITAQAAAITSFTTNLSGTPTDGQTLWISITDDGTARAITWGTSFESSGNITLPTTTVISTRLDVGFIWNTVSSKWRCVGVA